MQARPLTLWMRKHGNFFGSRSQAGVLLMWLGMGQAFAETGQLRYVSSASASSFILSFVHQWRQESVRLRLLRSLMRSNCAGRLVLGNPCHSAA